MGIRPPYATQSTPCIVVCAQWPGWLCTLPTFSFSCIHCFTDYHEAPWIKSLVAAHPHCVSSPLSAMSTYNGLVSTPSFCFVQGPTALIHQLPHQWLTEWNVIFSMDQDQVPCLPWAGSSLCHLDYGGVLSGHWSFFSNRQEQLPPPAPPQLMQRRLRHIIDESRPVSEFYTIDPPAQQEAVYFGGPKWTDRTNTVLDWHGALPSFSADSVLVRCPLIYSPTRWAVRKLTKKELLAAYDISETLLTAVVDTKGAKLPFLQSAPNRLLGAILSVLEHGNSIQEKVIELPSPPNQTPPPTPPQWPSSAQPQWVGMSDSTTKADDAGISVELWDQRVLHLINDPLRAQRFTSTYGISPMDSLRAFLLRIWRRRVSRSLQRFLRLEYGSHWADNPAASRDVVVGRECLSRAMSASWWEWLHGSTPFFWRWPPAARLLIRDGHPPWFLATPPTFLRPQRPERDSVMRDKVCRKLQTVCDKRYIAPGFVRGLTSFFAVPKGTSDVRMVYDASASGLNACLWVPTFALPTAETLVDNMGVNSWMGDLDMGEQFLNFPLHPDLQPFCGIDLRPYFTPQSGKTLWMRWVRCMMGLRPSPYFAVQGTYLGEEVAFGDRQDLSNPFHWDHVKLNLPGSSSYDPMLPWVMRLTRDGSLAGMSLRYVDDLRTLGNSEEHCWQVGHRLTTFFTYLGLQIALRKLRPPNQHPGPWAGTIAFSCPMGVGVTCSTDKWDKAKHLLAVLRQNLDSNSALQRKPLEQMRGFFVHLMRTFPVITPYLKGLHLTLDGWRGNRDVELWKLPRHEWDDSDATLPLEEAPATVLPAPRLRDDLDCLEALFSGPQAPTRLVRATKRAVAIYGFVDASSSGFGSSFELPDGAILFRHGVWGRDADSVTSNFRELCNLVESLEDGVACGELQDAELFIFTDNTTAEGGYYRGNSDNRFLFHLILRLRLLEMQASLRLHIIHVAGTRMIHQGTDGLSRGVMTDGVFSADPMKLHIPLHLSALDRSPTLLQWIRSWCPLATIQPLTPEEWFTTGHGIGGFIHNSDGVPIPVPSSQHWFLWAPAPAAGRHALDELATSRHKRPHINHIFICPRLFTSQWRRALYKFADAIIEIPAGSREFWPPTMHEPLVLGLTLRFAARPPWLLRNHPRLLALVRSLRTLWPSVSGDERGLLRELCNSPVALETLW